MLNRYGLVLWGVLLTADLLGLSLVASAHGLEVQEPVSFMKQIAPILKENCFACHNAQQFKGKLDMTTFASLTKGGERGEAIVPQKPEQSLLYTLITGKDDPHMPPKDVSKPLPEASVQLIERWIREGARFDGNSQEESILAALRRTWQPPVPPTHYARPLPITSLLLTADARYLLVGGYHEILLFDLGKEKPQPKTAAQLVGRVRIRPERVHALLWLNDGKTLALAGGRAGQEGNVQLLHFDVSQWISSPVTIKDGTQPLGGIFDRELLQTNDVMLTLAHEPKGSWLAAGGSDRIVHLWKLPEAKPEAVDMAHADWIYGLAFTQDGKLMISTSRDKTCKSWNLEQKSLVYTFRDHQATVYSCWPKPDNKTIISVGEDSPLRLWTLDGSNKQTRILPGHGKAVYQIVAIPNSSFLATCSGDQTVRIWNHDNGRGMRNLTGLNAPIYAMTVAPDGSWIAAGSSQGEVALWKVQDRTATPMVQFKAYPSPQTSP